MKPDHPWTAAEMRELHRRYIAGEFPSELARARRRSGQWLLARFRAHGWAIRERKTPVMPRRLPAAVAEAMYADYQAGMTLADVERKHQRPKSSARNIFQTRGWPMRPPPQNAWRQYRPDGTFQSMPPKTPEEIEALILAADRVMIPAALRTEWRKWTMDRRGDFIRRLRARLRDPLDMPDLPFSSNVKPFDYASEEAWNIARAANGDLESRRLVMQIKLVSQGVIWDGRLWFWVRHDRYYAEAVQWRPDRPRRLLARVIWESVHGPLPPRAVVRLIDGNPNNLDPSNLTISDKNEVCRENQMAALTRKSRERAAILLNQHQNPRHEHTHILQNLGRRPR